MEEKREGDRLDKYHSRNIGVIRTEGELKVGRRIRTE